LRYLRLVIELSEFVLLLCVVAHRIMRSMESEKQVCLSCTSH